MITERVTLTSQSVGASKRGTRNMWLNQGLYLSSNPGISVGGVALTFYESAH